MGESNAGADGQAPAGRGWVQLLARVGLYLLAVAALVWLVRLLGDVLFPVFVSLVAAYLLDPVIDWFEERNVPRSAAIGIVVFAALIFVTVFVLFLYPTVVAQIERISEKLPELVPAIEDRFVPWIERTFEVSVPSEVGGVLERYGKSITEAAPSVVQGLGASLGNVATGTGALVGRLMYLVMIPLFTFYFLRDFDRIVDGMRRFVPRRRRDYFLDRLREMDEVVGDWCRGQIKVAVILSVLYGIGLAGAFAVAGLDIKSGMAIGVLSGVLNVVPYVGVMVGLVLSVLLLLLNFSGLVAFLAVAGVFVFVQTLEGYWITPRVVGEKVGLEPVTVIIVLLIGGELFGLVGFVLAIPAFGALKVLFPDFVALYEQTEWYGGPGSDEGREPAGETDCGEDTRDGRG